MSVLNPQAYRELTLSMVPIHTGEQIYLRHNFKELIEMQAVRVIGPDPADIGGIAELKWVAEHAYMHSIMMAPHGTANGVAFIANLHLGAALASLMAVEHHALEVPWWTDIVTGIAPDYLADGYAAVPEAPGLGIELNEDVIREHLVPWSDYFDATENWNAERVGFLGHLVW